MSDFNFIVLEGRVSQRPVLIDNAVRFRIMTVRNAGDNKIYSDFDIIANSIFGNSLSLLDKLKVDDRYLVSGIALGDGSVIIKKIRYLGGTK